MYSVAPSLSEIDCHLWRQRHERLLDYCIKSCEMKKLFAINLWKLKRAW